MKRKWVQLISTIIHNGYPGFLITHNIYSGIFKNFCAPGLNCHSCPASLFACPIGILQNFFISVKNLPWHFLIGTFSYIVSFFLIFGLLLGRFICGWLCPFGFFQELLYKIPFLKRTFFLPYQLEKKLKILIFLFFIVILPLSISNELGYGIFWFCKYLCPAGTLEAGYFNLILQTHLFSLIGFIFLIKTLFLIFIIFLCLMQFRFFCKNLCPLGFIYGLFNTIGFFKLHLTQNNCNSCKICEKVCPFNLSIPEELNSIECIRCLNCLKICPTKAITIKFNKNFS